MGSPGAACPQGKHAGWVCNPGATCQLCTLEQGCWALQASVSSFVQWGHWCLARCRCEDGLALRGVPSLGLAFSLG